MFTIWVIGYIVSCVLVLAMIIHEDKERDFEPNKFLGLLIVGFIIFSPFWFIVWPAFFISEKLLK